MLQERMKQNEKKRHADRAKKGKSEVVRKTITRNGRVLDVVEKMLEECRRRRRLRKRPEERRIRLACDALRRWSEV